MQQVHMIFTMLQYNHSDLQPVFPIREHEQPHRNVFITPIKPLPSSLLVLIIASYILCITQMGQVQRKTQEMAILVKWLWLCVILSHQSESINGTCAAVWCFSKFHISILFRACSSSSFLLRLENVFFTAGHTTLEHWCFKSKIFFQDCSPRRASWPNAWEGKCTFKDYFSWNLYFESRFKMTVRRGKGWTQCYQVSLNWRWYIYAVRAWTREPVKGTFGSSPLPPLHPAINWFDTDVLIYVHPLCRPVSASACLWMMNKKYCKWNGSNAEQIN